MIFAAHRPIDINHSSYRGIGYYPYPADAMDDRAQGLLLKGRAKTAIANYGNFIDWASFPAGLWGDYAYLPHIGFMAGVPGHVFSAEFNWDDIIF